MENIGEFVMAVQLLREAKILEYWRKRYLGQAVIVVCLAVGVVWTAFVYVDFWLLKVLVFLVALLVVYKMIGALRDGLQARGEGLILAKGEEAFGEVMFDVGRGLCENALLVQDVVASYQVRECDNVMRGKGYFLEEDWFYSVVSAKYVPINQTMFEGVVLAFADKGGNRVEKGELLLVDKVMSVTGDLAPRLRENAQVMEVISSFMRLFGAKKATLSTADDTFYVWLNTPNKLFYQFSLLRPNTLMLFQKRIEQLQSLSQKMLSVLNG